MKNINKKVLALLLALSVVISLAGCGGNNSDNSGSSKPTNSGSTQMDADEAAFFDDIPAELIGTTVKFATWIDHTKTEAAPVMADFTDLTGINVALDTISQGEYITKLSARIAAGQSPDIVVENGDWPRTLACLTPLDECGVDVTDPFWDQQVVKYSTIGKKTYLVNGKNSIWNMSSAVVYYNKTIFEDYSIKTPTEYIEEGNWTWETFKKAMKDVKSSDSELYGASIDANAFSRSYKGLWVKFDPDADTFSNVSSSSELLDVYKYMLEAKEAGYAKVVSNGVAGEFTSGKCGMALAGAYGLRATGWLTTMDPDDIEFAHLPKRNKSDESYPSGSTFRSYGVCKGSKNPVAAGYFLRYFLNGDNYDPETIYLNDEAEKWYTELRDCADMSLMHWTGGVYGTIYTAGVGYMNDLLSGSSSQVKTNIAKVSGTLDKCIAEANKILQDVIAKQ